MRETGGDFQADLQVGLKLLSCLPCCFGFGFFSVFVGLVTLMQARAT